MNIERGHKDSLELVFLVFFPESIELQLHHITPKCLAKIWKNTMANSFIFFTAEFPSTKNADDIILPWKTGYPWQRQDDKTLPGCE